MSPAPSIIVASTVLAQLFILATMAVGALILRRSTDFSRSYDETYSDLGWCVLVVAIASLASLVLSDAFSSLWRPLLPLGHGGIGWHKAVVGTFFMNGAAVFYLVFRTGGSERSPFAPLWWLLPTIALLLREPSGWIALYATAVAFSFILLLARTSPRRAEDENRPRGAYAVVSLLCLLAACATGILTRGH